MAYKLSTVEFDSDQGRKQDGQSSWTFSTNRGNTNLDAWSSRTRVRICRTSGCRAFAPGWKSSRTCVKDKVVRNANWRLSLLLPSTSPSEVPPGLLSDEEDSSSSSPEMAEPIVALDGRAVSIAVAWGSILLLDPHALTADTDSTASLARARRASSPQLLFRLSRSKES